MGRLRGDTAFPTYHQWTRGVWRPAGVQVAPCVDMALQGLQRRTPVPICGQVHKGSSHCRGGLLSRMVLERLTREKCGFYYRIWQQGRMPVASRELARRNAPARAGRVFSYWLGQWKPSSSPFTPLAPHAVAPFTLSAPLVAPHVVVTARVGALSAGFEQSAQHASTLMPSYPRGAKRLRGRCKVCSGSVMQASLGGCYTRLCVQGVGPSRTRRRQCPRRWSLTWRTRFRRCGAWETHVGQPCLAPGSLGSECCATATSNVASPSTSRDR